MATKSAALTSPVKFELSRSVKNSVVRFAEAARRWARNGQLGSYASTEIGRHTGGRI